MGVFLKCLKNVILEKQIEKKTNDTFITQIFNTKSTASLHEFILIKMFLFHLDAGSPMVEDCDLAGLLGYTVCTYIIRIYLHNTRNFSAVIYEWHNEIWHNHGEFSIRMFYMD